MERSASILVTGGTGLVGTALVALLRREGYTRVQALGGRDCDLTDHTAALALFRRLRPDYVFHLAAAVYGIMGNMQNKGISFLRNTLMNTAVVEGARLAGVRKIVCMGSGCVYPFPAPGMPLREDMLWLGEPHGSEDSYAHAKRAMLAQLKAYRESYGMDYAFAISGNLYGPHDRFDPEWGHVTPSLVHKFHAALHDGGKVIVWGDGSSRRDFMYSDDAAQALLAVMRHLSGPVNLGSGQVHAVREIVDILADLTGLRDRVVWDPSKPNGQDLRFYDLGKLFTAGFVPTVSLAEGLERTFRWYERNAASARR